MKKKIIYINLAVHVSLFAVSQTKIDSTYFSSVDSASSFYRIKPGVDAKPENVLFKIAEMFNLSNQHTFINYKTNTDELNNKHLKFQHYYKGIPVYGSQLFLHSNSDGVVSVANGFIASRFNLNMQINIKPDEVLEYALREVNSKKYMWQDEVSESQLKADKHDPNATYYPKPELMYYPNPITKVYVPVYRILISTLEPFNKEYLIVSAVNGSVLKRFSALDLCSPEKRKTSVPNDASSCDGDCHNGQTNTLYYGVQAVKLGKHKFGSFGDCKFRLLDGCYNTVIHTVSKTNISYNSNSGVEEFTDQTNFFNFNPTTPGGTAHWCTEMATEFYRYTLGREGMNGTATGSNPFFFNVWLNSNSNGSDNAFYDHSTDDINFGSGGTSLAANHVTALDVVGHEYSHGVSRYEANFDGDGEPGALKESFSDIFGTLIEYYAKSNHGTGSNFSYVYSNDAYFHAQYTLGTGSYYVDRDMTYPNNSLMPDTYAGTYWINPTLTSEDHGGIHENCMIQDYWFYLLAEGGSGVNDKGNAFCVKGIGKDKAMRIAYYNLTNFMGTFSNFSAAANGAIQTAINLYGLASPELAETIAAWYAVGVINFNMTPFGYIQLGSKTETGFAQYNYNQAIRLDFYTALPSANVDMSSNNYIAITSNRINPPLSPPTVGDTKIQGEFHAYIAPSCNGGARSDNSDPNTIEENIPDENFTTQNSNDSQNIDCFSIIPNPSHGEFILTLNKEVELPGSIEIHDMMGKLVYRLANINDYLLKIDLSDLSGGVFLVKAIYNKHVFTKRVLKVEK